MTQEQMQEIAKSVASEIVEKSRGERNVVATKSEPSKFSALRDLSTFGALLKAVANAKGGGREETVRAAEKFGGAEMAKAIQESVFDSAGVLVPVQNSSEVIEFLRPVSLMDKLGIRTVAFKAQLEIPKQTGTAALTWIGEGDTVSETKPAFGKIVLKAHKAMAILNLSNDLLRNPAVGDAFAGEDARLAMAHGLDDAMLNGSGVSGQPLGLLKQINANNSFARAGVTAANYIADADKAVEKVLSADVAISAPAWIMSPTKEAELLGLRDSAGYIFRDEMLGAKTFRGFPYVCSTRVATTKIIFGCWDQLIYGVDEAVNVSLHADTRAAYDETVLRAVLRADFKVRYDKAFAEIRNS